MTHRPLFLDTYSALGRRRSAQRSGTGRTGHFTPDDAIWWIGRERVLMLGGGRALLMQACHPLVLAGFLEHSKYEADPWKRFQQTMEAIWTAIYGTSEQAAAVGHRVCRVHAQVRGTLDRPLGSCLPGTPYDASDPELLMWVHATTIDTALVMYRAYVRPLSKEETEAFYEDGKVIARLFGISEEVMPATYGDFRAYWRQMLGGGLIRVTKEARDLSRVLLEPPIPVVARPAWRIVNLVTAGFLPQRLREDYGFAWTPAHRALLGISAGYVKRFVVPSLPDVVRTLPDARRAECRLQVTAA